jgi:hypothetical protein
MTLVQKNINNTMYYTDGVNYYTFHVVNVPKDALTEFACRELGIPMKPQFTQDESARLAQLAGTGIQNRTKYELLKNGQAVPVPYHLVGAPKLNTGDILLHKVAAPSGSSAPPAGLIKCRHCSSETPPGPTCKWCGKPL